MAKQSDVIKEFCKLVSENPDLPVKVMCDTDSLYNEDFPISEGSFNKAKIYYYYLNGDEILLDDQIEEAIEHEIEEDEDITVELSYDEIKSLAATIFDTRKSEGKIFKAIVLTIN